MTTVAVPEAVYHDRHGIFDRSPQELAEVVEQLAGAREPSQVRHAVRELGIVSIAAHSPQAKGRVKRLFGTLQARLVSELRLTGAATLAEANAVLARYLPRCNARFAMLGRRCGVRLASPWGPDRSVAGLLFALRAHRGAR